MASFGIETPADIGSIPEANTVNYPADNRIMDNYWKGAEMQYRNKVLQYRQQKDAIDNRIKALDFNTAGTWERDLPYVNQKLADYTNYVSENPQALSPSINDVKFAVEGSKQANDVKYWATKSKADKAMYDENKKAIATNPQLKKHAADYMTQLDAWANQPVDQRGDFELKVQPDWNILADQDKKVKLLQYDNPNIKSTPDQYGNVTYSFDQGQPKTDSLIGYLKNRFDTMDEEAQAAAEQFQALSPQEQAQYRQDGSDGVKNYYVDVELSGIPMDSKSKQIVRGNWASQFAAKQEAAKPDITWVVDNMNSINNLPSIEKTGDTVNPNPSQMSTAANGVEITLPGGEKDVITGVFKVGGTLYARTASRQNDDGSVKFEDLQPITNTRNQLAVPLINSLVSKGQLIGTVSDFVKQFDRSASDSGSKSSKITSQKSGTIKVSLNGQLGEIPADQWEAFKKKYPNAIKQ